MKAKRKTTRNPRGGIKSGQTEAERIKQARVAQAAPSRPWEPHAGRIHMRPVLGWKPYTRAQARAADKKAAKGGHRSKSTDALHRCAPGSFESGKRR
jgi:hypothetical protein